MPVAAAVRDCQLAIKTSEGSARNRGGWVPILPALPSRRYPTRRTSQRQPACRL